MALLVDNLFRQLPAITYPSVIRIQQLSLPPFVRSLRLSLD